MIGLAGTKVLSEERLLHDEINLNNACSKIFNGIFPRGAARLNSYAVGLLLDLEACIRKN